MSISAVPSGGSSRAVIEINEACCCYISLLIPSKRRETDEGRINSLLRSSSMPTISWQGWEVGLGGNEEGGQQSTICISPYSQLIQPKSIALIQQQLK